MAKKSKSGSVGMLAWPQMGLPNESADVLMKANARAMQMWLDSWTRLAGEMSSFAMRRWARDAETFRKCSACKTPIELFELQAAFVQSMFGDYMREAARVADMEKDAATAEINEIDKGVREATGLVASAGIAAASKAKQAARP
jgi:hypothetical protein